MNTKALKLYANLPWKHDVIKLEMNENSFKFIMQDVASALAFEILNNCYNIINVEKDELAFAFNEGVLDVNIYFHE